MGDFEEGPATETHIEVTRSSWVRISTVIAIVVALWRSYSWLDDRFAAATAAATATNVKIDETNARLADLKRRVDEAAQNNWTSVDQRLFILELQLRNRTLVVPMNEGKR